MTQLERARENEVTPEMKFVAAREDLPEELVRSEVARGRMVIPANTVHLTKCLEKTLPNTSQTSPSNF